MKHATKLVFLTVAKWLGLFHLSRYLYRDRLVVLCYHGFAYEDEHRFRPSLFMTIGKLNQRLAWLAKNGFRVLGLEKSIERLYESALPAKSVAITIDDGFRSVGELAGPVFQRYDMPTTLYVTSYYVQKETPIFRLIMQYMNWKTGQNPERLQEIVNELPEEAKARINHDREPIWQLIDYGEQYLTEEQRVALSKTVAQRLRIDYDHIRETGMMSLMTESEVLSLADMGIDVQLHTHRHVLPDGHQEAEREIRDNRAVLEPLLSHALVHFCYPSGVWNRGHWSILEKLGIRSAVTCDPGLNDRSTSPLGLRRLLDNEDMAQIEFEAELYGLKELIRDARARLTGRPR